MSCVCWVVVSNSSAAGKRSSLQAAHDCSQKKIHVHPNIGPASATLDQYLSKHGLDARARVPIRIDDHTSCDCYASRREYTSWPGVSPRQQFAVMTAGE